MAAGSGWRGLGLFWAGVLVLAGAGAGTLQVLGPPGQAPKPAVVHAEPDPHAGPATAVPGTVAAGPVTAGPVTAGPVTAGPVTAGPVTAGPVTSPPAPSAPDPKRVAAPDAALLERSPGFPGAQLPRIGADGRAPRTAYAAPAPRPPSGVPQIALLLSGFGQSEKDSRAAIDALPGAVSFAVSAYAGAPAGLYDAARAAGHELLASIPMEPQGFPLNDAGSRSLLTGLTPEDNRLNLEWALGRLQGAVGATGASDGMRGERFADLAGAFDPVLDEIGRRGLLYVDARPGRTPQRPGLAARGIDVVLDDPPGRAEIEGKLAVLERIARERGGAIGLVGLPRPVTVERLAAWTQALQGRGMVLVPVSSLVGVVR